VARTAASLNWSVKRCYVARMTSWRSCADRALRDSEPSLTSCRRTAGARSHCWTCARQIRRGGCLRATEASLRDLTRVEGAPSSGCRRPCRLDFRTGSDAALVCAVSSTPSGCPFSSKQPSPGSVLLSRGRSSSTLTTPGRSPRVEAVAQTTPNSGASSGRGTPPCMSAARSRIVGQEPRSGPFRLAPSHRSPTRSISPVYATASAQSASPASVAGAVASRQQGIADSADLVRSASAPTDCCSNPPWR